MTGRINRSGGARPGAGRKKGSPNKITQVHLSKAQAEGVMPLHVALDIMRKRHAKLEVLRRTTGVTDAQVTAAENLTLEAAERALPYTHHRLQAMTHKLEPLDLSKLSDDELKVVYELRAKLSSNTA